VFLYYYVCIFSRRKDNPATERLGWMPTIL
jgi:hypothetical protein